MIYYVTSTPRTRRKCQRGDGKNSKKTILEQKIANARNYFWLFDGKIYGHQNFKFVIWYEPEVGVYVCVDVPAAPVCSLMSADVLLFFISALSCNNEMFSLIMLNIAATFNSPKIYQNIGRVTEYF